MASFNNNIQLLGCIRVVLSGGCQDITMINCSGMTGDPSMNRMTYVNNGRVLGNIWTTLTTANADASQPYTVDGFAGNKYKVDTSSGDIYVTLNLTALNGECIWLKVIDATNNIVINTTSGTGNFEFNAVPYTITGLVQGDSFTISSDGTDLFII